MNLSEDQPQTLLINVDLLFDFYSVLFSAYRTYFARQSISINNLKHLIEGKSLDQGLISLINEVSQGLDVQQTKDELFPLLDISLKTIKPTIAVCTLCIYNVKLFVYLFSEGLNWQWRNCENFH